MRSIFVAFVCTAATLVGSCTYFPSLEGPLGIGSVIHEVPVSAVAKRIQCELKDFLTSPANADILDPLQPTNLTLFLQLDNTGSVNYVGIDLNKLGLNSLAELVAAQNKVPALQAKAQAKGVISSQVDFAVPQTIPSITIPSKWVVNPDTGRLKRTKPTLIKGLDLVECEEPTHEHVSRIYLRKWLERFFHRLDGDPSSNEAACMSKITLKTQFQLIFLFSAGLTPPLGAPLVIPISGINVDYNPAYTHSLQITLALKKDTNLDLCTKIPNNQPNTRI